MISTSEVGGPEVNIDRVSRQDPTLFHRLSRAALVFTLLGMLVVPLVTDYWSINEVDGTTAAEPA